MTSRRELYAAGEPLGDNVTRPKLGGGYICGGGGDSTSSNTQATTTNQYDMRSVTDSRQQNTTTNTSTSTVNNITTADPGAIEAGKSIALASLNSNSTNTATLLAVADSLFSKTTDALAANTKLTATLASGANAAYSDATSQATGNKNLVYAGLAVVGLVAVSMLARKG